MKDERELWLTIRRGLLLIAGAIEQEPNAPPVLVAVRRGVLLIAAGIAKQYAGR